MERNYSTDVSFFVSEQIHEVKKRNIIDHTRIKHYLRYRFRSLRDQYKIDQEGFQFYNRCLTELNNRI